MERTDILECAWHRRQEEADDAELQAALVGIILNNSIKNWNEKPYW